jgi:hypothetical protein
MPKIKQVFNAIHMLIDVHDDGNVIELTFREVNSDVFIFEQGANVGDFERDINKTLEEDAKDWAINAW